MSVLAFADTSAKTASWAISPKYDKLSRLDYDIFIFQQSGKFGLVRPGNITLTSASFDYISSFINGYALACIKEGDKYLLKYIIDKNGSVVYIDGTYYLLSPIKGQYVSENKIPVSNRSGKCGYMNTNGKLVVKCQFDNALPFKQGMAPVKTGYYMHFINETYDNTGYLLPVDFHDGDITDATCFSNGEAMVAYNTDIALIDLYGNKVRKVKDSQIGQIYAEKMSLPQKHTALSLGRMYDYVTKNGLYGITENGKTILTPQFSNVSGSYDDGLIIVNQNNKYGVISINEGDYAFGFASMAGSRSNLKVDRNGNIENVVIDISLPKATNNLKLLVDHGDRQMRDITSQISFNGANASVSVLPLSLEKADTCMIKAVLEDNGIIVAEKSNAFTLSYPIRLTVSTPGPSEIWANQYDHATFSSTIRNDSDKSVTVRAIWSTGASQDNITIGPHSTKTVSSSIYVDHEHRRTIAISLSTGETNSRSILFHPFF